MKIKFGKLKFIKGSDFGPIRVKTTYNAKGKTIDINIGRGWIILGMVVVIITIVSLM